VPVAIDKPSKYFNTVLYTGTGATQSVTGVGFKPDFTWIKTRSNTNFHNLTDSVRGVTKQLFTNTNIVEQTSAVYLSSFDTDGFTVSTDTDVNGSARTYVGWSWLGSGTTAVSNTSGTITSTVSANTTSGFSIVSYTGNGTNNATVGHGLGVTPAMLIVKNRDVADGWGVWNKGLGSATQQIQLNGTGAVFTDDVFNAVSSTTVTLGTDTWSNTSTKNYIMYCWSEVKGYSKFGSYTGNGSTDGTYVHLGFTPAFVMIKRSSSTGNWELFDNKRDIDNTVGHFLEANTSFAESDLSASHTPLDFLSNGFKLRNSSLAGDTNINLSGSSYIYMAFASSPFVSSKSIPTTAR
jgi:hypothetical protein